MKSLYKAKQSKAKKQQLCAQNATFSQMLFSKHMCWITGGKFHQQQACGKKSMYTYTYT